MTTSGATTSRVSRVWFITGANFFGALWVSQAVLPHLRAQGSGHVVQISSIGALGGFPSTGPTARASSRWRA